MKRHFEASTIVGPSGLPVPKYLPLLGFLAAAMLSSYIPDPVYGNGETAPAAGMPEPSFSLRALQIARHGLSELWPVLFPEWPEKNVRNVSHNDVEDGLLKLDTKLSGAYGFPSEKIHEALKWELDSCFATPGALKGYSGTAGILSLIKSNDLLPIKTFRATLPMPEATEKTSYATVCVVEAYKLLVHEAAAELEKGSGRIPLASLVVSRVLKGAGDALKDPETSVLIREAARRYVTDRKVFSSLIWTRILQQTKYQVTARLVRALSDFPKPAGGTSGAPVNDQRTILKAARCIAEAGCISASYSSLQEKASNCLAATLFKRTPAPTEPTTASLPSIRSVFLEGLTELFATVEEAISAAEDIAVRQQITWALLQSALEVYSALPGRSTGFLQQTLNAKAEVAKVILSGLQACDGEQREQLLRVVTIVHSNSCGLLHRPLQLTAYTLQNMEVVADAVGSSISSAASAALERLRSSAVSAAMNFIGSFIVNMQIVCKHVVSRVKRYATPLRNCILKSIEQLPNKLQAAFLAKHLSFICQTIAELEIASPSAYSEALARVKRSLLEVASLMTSHEGVDVQLLLPGAAGQPNTFDAMKGLSDDKLTQLAETYSLGDLSSPSSEHFKVLKRRSENETPQTSQLFLDICQTVSAINSEVASLPFKKRLDVLGVRTNLSIAAILQSMSNQVADSILRGILVNWQGLTKMQELSATTLAQIISEGIKAEIKVEHISADRRIEFQLSPTVQRLVKRGLATRTVLEKTKTPGRTEEAGEQPRPGSTEGGQWAMLYGISPLFFVDAAYGCVKAIVPAVLADKKIVTDCADAAGVAFVPIGGCPTPSDAFQKACVKNPKLLHDHMSRWLDFSGVSPGCRDILLYLEDREVDMDLRHLIVTELGHLDCGRDARNRDSWARAALKAEALQQLFIQYKAEYRDSSFSKFVELLYSVKTGAVSTSRSVAQSSTRRFPVGRSMTALHHAVKSVISRSQQYRQCNPDELRIAQELFETVEVLRYSGPTDVEGPAFALKTVVEKSEKTIRFEPDALANLQANPVYLKQRFYNFVVTDPGRPKVTLRFPYYVEKHVEGTFRTSPAATLPIVHALESARCVEPPALNEAEQAFREAVDSTVGWLQTVLDSRLSATFTTTSRGPQATLRSASPPYHYPLDPRYAHILDVCNWSVSSLPPRGCESRPREDMTVTLPWKPLKPPDVKDLTPQPLHKEELPGGTTVRPLVPPPAEEPPQPPSVPERPTMLPPEVPHEVVSPLPERLQPAPLPEEPLTLPPEEFRGTAPAPQEEPSRVTVPEEPTEEPLEAYQPPVVPGEVRPEPEVTLEKPLPAPEKETAVTGIRQGLPAEDGCISMVKLYSHYIEQEDIKDIDELFGKALEMPMFAATFASLGFDTSSRSLPQLRFAMCITCGKLLPSIVLEKAQGHTGPLAASFGSSRQFCENLYKTQEWIRFFEGGTVVTVQTPHCPAAKSLQINLPTRELEHRMTKMLREGVYTADEEDVVSQCAAATVITASYQDIQSVLLGINKSAGGLLAQWSNLKVSKGQSGKHSLCGETIAAVSEVLRTREEDSSGQPTAPISLAGAFNSFADTHSSPATYVRIVHSKIRKKGDVFLAAFCAALRSAEVIHTFLRSGQVYQRSLMLWQSMLLEGLSRHLEALSQSASEKKMSLSAAVCRNKPAGLVIERLLAQLDPSVWAEEILKSPARENPAFTEIEGGRSPASPEHVRRSGNSSEGRRPYISEL